MPGGRRWAVVSPLSERPVAVWLRRRHPQGVEWHLRRLPPYDSARSRNCIGSPIIKPSNPGTRRPKPGPMRTPLSLGSNRTSPTNRLRPGSVTASLSNSSQRPLNRTLACGNRSSSNAVKCRPKVLGCPRPPQPRQLQISRPWWRAGPASQWAALAGRWRMLHRATQPSRGGWMTPRLAA